MIIFYKKTSASFVKTKEADVESILFCIKEFYLKKSLNQRVKNQYCFRHLQLKQYL